MSRLPSSSLLQRAAAGALAGLTGGLGHAAMNEIDRAVLNHNADDMVMLGGVFTDDVPRARRIGFGMHMNFAAMFGAAYAMLLHPRDDQDALKKGLAFALIENFGLFPLGILVDKYHPHSGKPGNDPFFHPRSLVEATLRHTVLGFGIGKSYPFILRLIRG